MWFKNALPMVIYSNIVSMYFKKVILLHSNMCMGNALRMLRCFPMIKIDPLLINSSNPPNKQIKRPSKNLREC